MLDLVTSANETAIVILATTLLACTCVVSASANLVEDLGGTLRQQTR